MPTAKTRELSYQAESADVFDQLIGRIVEAVHPLRIILFGSRAQGKARSQSDFDLLVVMPDGTPQRQTARQLYTAKIGIDAAADILVATPSMLEKHRTNPGLIYREILETGHEVYGRVA